MGRVTKQTEAEIERADGQRRPAALVGFLDAGRYRSRAILRRRPILSSIGGCEA
jgi:hypothetical protein